MEVLIEKKMIGINEELLLVQSDHLPKSRVPVELEPSEEFPILYGLLTAPKSFKPKNREELESLPQELGQLDDQEDIISMEEADSQNLDFNGNISRSTSSSPQTVDSSSNLSSTDENDSPMFSNYLRNNNNSDTRRSSSNFGVGDLSEDESLMGYSPSEISAEGDDSIDDNIPTSTTSGFKRKASRLETAIGNIVRRRRVQKRSSPTSNTRSSVPISMAPSSPTVSTTCIDLPVPSPSQHPRGRSEILERILRSSTSNTVNNPTTREQSSGRFNEQRDDCGRNNDDNNNECNGNEPYAKLRDLLTMPEDQLVKRRRIEYGLNSNNDRTHSVKSDGTHEQVRREFSPPRNNILASLLQKGRPYESQLRGGRYPFENNSGAARAPPALVSINNFKYSSDNRSNTNVNDERPYKCSLCDLRFKKLPLLNRHVKTHSHIKRYVCRFCSHAFKRSDNLLAHMRTSCKGIKEADANFADDTHSAGSIINRRVSPSLLSSSSTSGLGQVLSSTPLVSRSQLEEALLNLRGHTEQLNGENDRHTSSPLVSTTTTSPPPLEAQGQILQPEPDFQSRHSKLLEILSGSPVIVNPLVIDTGEDNLEEDMPLPLSLKVERSCSSPPSRSPCSSSQSQLPRSHHTFFFNSNLAKHNNELPLNDAKEEEEEDNEANDNERPLNLGSIRPPAVSSSSAASSCSRDHPEIVSILSRQPKNVVMMAPDLRKLVGLDSL